MIHSVKERKKTAAPPKIRKVAEAKNVVEYRLDNGLKLLLLENHTAPVVTFLVVYRVGSRNEAVGHTGSTHFLEHMLFKGTKKHNAEKGNGIDDLLTQIGAYWNATTWFDRTSYFEVVPAAYLDLCVELEADRMRNLLLRQEDHDSEMSVVRNELERGENYPEDALEKELYAIAFREHPYHHPTIGWRTDVEGVPMDRLREFYNTFYWPNNATAIIVGDFDQEQALEIVQEHFGKIPASPHEIPQVYTKEPPQEGERRFEINRAGDLERCWVGFHVSEAEHEDNYPLAAIRHILGSTYERSSRLYKRLIDTSMASEAFCRHDDLRDPGLFIVGATVNPDVGPDKVEEAILDELERLGKEPVSKEELERAKSSNRKGTILAKADPSSLAFMLGEAESKSNWQWLMNYDDKFDAVTTDDIKRVARKYFTRNNRTIGLFVPRVPEPPGGQQMIAAPKHEAAQRSEKKKKGEPSIKELVSYTPAPAKIKLKKEKPGATFTDRVEKEVLSNGLTLLLMRNPGTESVGVSGNVRSGKFFTHNGNGTLAEVLSDLLPKGSQRYDKTRIAEVLEGMGIPAGLEFSIDNYRMGFGSHVVAKDLPQYLDLMADVVRNPLISEDELSKTKVEWVARYTEALNNTRMMAWNALRRSLYAPNHPFFEKNFEEQIKELNKLQRNELKQYHERYFSPHSTIITMVGDIDLRQARKLIEERFGDWQGPPANAIEVPAAPIPESAKRVEVSLPDKKSVDIVMANPCTLKRSDKEFYAARLANRTLGQDTITSRLGQIVRDRAGLTYGIYSAFSDTAFGAAPWSVSLSVNPTNIERALLLVSEVLKDYLKNGISKDELIKETGRAVGSFKVGLASSLGMARALTEFEFLGLGTTELDSLTDRYMSVTKDQVDQAIKRYFHPSKAITAIAGTF